MGLSLNTGQYGGSRAPAVSPSQGGASVLSGLGSAAMGMLTGGGSVAIQAAIEASKDQPTTQAPSSNNYQTTGSKTIGSQPGQAALKYNDFWADNVTNTSNLPLYIALLVLGLVGFFVLRRFAK